MRSLLVMFLGLVVASCVTQKRCLEKWPPSIMYHDTVIYKDTTLYVALPPDTVFGSDTVMIINHQAVSIDTMVLETDYAIAWAWVTGSRIHQRLAHKITALELRYDSLLRERTKVITLTQIVKEKPRFNGILWQVIALAGIILLIILAIRIRSGWP